MPSKYRIILEMASQTARDIASNADRYTDFLITAANNYKYCFSSFVVSKKIVTVFLLAQTVALRNQRIGF